MKVQIVLGTRPEVIKLAPVIHELQRQSVAFSIIHTGQHYSTNMDEIFWQLFDLPAPKYHLGIREPTHARQTSEMIRKMEEIFMNEKPDWVVVQGDTNSAMSGALAASKLPQIRIAHVEAGLRSWDRRMPEEVNRLICDHVSHLLFPPTDIALKNLEREGLGSRAQGVTGNTVEDSLKKHLPQALEQSDVLERFQLERKKFILMTVHRQENTEKAARLLRIFSAIFAQAEKHRLKVVFPIHPRTREIMKTSGYQFPEFVILIEPVGYLDFLKLQKEAKIAATDSGGVQEETCLLNTPCLTLRENTERPETIEIGANRLAGVSKEKIIFCFEEALASSLNWRTPYGNGLASIRIVEALMNFID